eukprot:1063303-Rhodomonas_salina.2
MPAGPAAHLRTQQKLTSTTPHAHCQPDDWPDDRDYVRLAAAPLGREVLHAGVDVVPVVVRPSSTRTGT